MRHGIQADEVGCRENSGFRPSERGTEKCIDLGDGYPFFQHHTDALADAVNADPVAYEVRCILCPDNAFAEPVLAEFSHEVQDLFLG